MNPSTPHVEDRLLDFAYDELSESEAREVQAHLDGCAHCADALREIQGVRRVMAKLPDQSAPDAGLSSLLAYAEQAARRVQAGPPPKPAWWRRLIVPVGGLAAVSVVFVVAQTTMNETDTDYSAQVVHAIQEKEAGPVAVVQPVLHAPVEEPAPAAPTSIFGSSRRKDAEADGIRMAVKKEAARSELESRGEIRERTRSAERRAGAEAKDARKAVAAAPPSAPMPDSVLGSGAAPPSASLSAKAEAMPMAKRARAAALADVTSAAEAESALDEAERRDVAVDRALANAQQLSSEAWAAYRNGDREREAALLRQAIATGVGEPALVAGLLNRLCDAEYALGNDAAGDAACQRVVREFSGQSAAQVAERKLRSRVAPATTGAPAEAVPAQAAPPARPNDR